MMNQPARFSVLCTVLAMFLTVLSLAEVQASAPETLTHQGRLLDDDGEPITGAVTLTYSLYDAASGGAVLWQDEVEVIAGEEGFFSTRLGTASNPITAELLSDGQAWLGIAVDGADELSPRLQLTSVPFALRAATAATAEAVAPGSITTDSLAGDFSISPDQFDGATLAGLSCVPGDVPIYQGGNWECGEIPNPLGPDWPVASGYTVVNHSAGNLIEYEVVVINQGNHYDLVTNLFTAPITGHYEMCASLTRSSSSGAYLATQVEGTPVFPGDGRWLYAHGDRGRHSSGCITFSAQAGERIGNYAIGNAAQCTSYIGRCDFSIRLVTPSN